MRLLPHGRCDTDINKKKLLETVAGTAHVSKASADEVRQLIQLVRPDVVLLEVDKVRAARLQNGKSASLLQFLRVSVAFEQKAHAYLLRQILCSCVSSVFVIVMQTSLPGVLMPGKQWGSSVVKLGVGGMYQALRMLGMDPGRPMMPCQVLPA